MAPLFGQRQKTQEELASGATVTTIRHNQDSSTNHSTGDGDGAIESARSADTHFKNVTNVHNSQFSSSKPNDSHVKYRQNDGNSAIPPPLPPCRPREQNGSTPSTNEKTAIRKYLVLLQDCLAIKFAPLVTSHQSHPYPFVFNNACDLNKHNGGGGDRNNAVVDDEDFVSHRHSDFHHHHPQHATLHPLVSNDNSNNSNKCNRNSISELPSNHRSHSHQGNNNNGSSCSHQRNHYTLGSNNAGIHYNNGDPQQAFHYKSSHHQQPNSRQHQLLQSSSSGGITNRPSSAHLDGSGGNFLGSNTAEVDHSLHALYLYKGFQEANLQCSWNAALNETFRNIQYKGYIVPSTVLVGALPKFLSILRTAWTRQMLKSPAGYRIEFIGEIEEVIADPIQKGQFAPLSDSLCWAILELTSLGQEAFVDSIMSALQVAFPTMSSPPKELVFQTLEKLIKERKVYQTSRGYFVVTPEIFRYMVSANLHEFDGTFSFDNNNPGLTLDALLPTSCGEQDKSSFSRQSWDSAADHNRCSSTSTGEDLIEVAPSPKLKRHNSLKLIRQRDVVTTQILGTTGHRRHSLRLPKSKSCGRMNDTAEDEEVKRAKVKSSTIEHISRAMRSLRTSTMTSANTNADSAGGNTADSEKGKQKSKSLLSKLFPFRRSNSKSRNEKITTAPPSATATAACRTSLCSNASTTTRSSSERSVSPPPTKTKHSENAKDSAKFISTQTQTSNSNEQLCLPSITLSSSSSPSHPALPETNPGRMMTVDSTAKRSSVVDVMLNPDSINGDGSHQTRSSSRRSMSILDESPLYDVLQDVSSSTPVNHSNGCSGNHISPNFQVGCPVAHPTYPGFHHHHHRVESSRCSTLSSQAASSLGYGSQGNPSLSSNNNYSQHLDSGLASYGYYGCDGSISSHSPCGATSCGQYGFNNNGGHQNSAGNNAACQPPAKPTSYSSARYKNSYEWYKRRYPNYISPAGRTSPLYASLTAPRSKSRSRATYESLLAPVERRHGDGLVQMTDNRRRSLVTAQDLENRNVGRYMNPRNSARHSHILSNIEMNRSDEHANTGESSTTVTQAVKSTTNMELELLLPLGKIMKAALQAKKDAIKDAWLKDELGPGYAAYANKSVSNQDSSSSGTNAMNGGGGGGSNDCENAMQNKDSSCIKLNLDNTGAKLRVGEPSTKTEVTTVVNNNGVIETHFDTSSGINQPMRDLLPPNMQSTVAIKTSGGVTDVVLVNGKTGQETKIIRTMGGGDSSQGQSQGINLHHTENDECKSYTGDQNYTSSYKVGNKSSLMNSSRDKRSTTCVKISDIGKDCSADEEAIKE